MSIRRLLDRFAASPTSIKIAITAVVLAWTCLLYTSDAADDN